MAKVVLDQISKIYPGDVTAVNGVSLDIADKEFLVFVGPSGCGKSTTLRMIAGLEDISQGTIKIGDKVVNDVPPKDRDIAMVFQNYALYPHMTVFKNMAFGLKLRGFPKAEINKRVNDAAEILGISELLGRKPKALSGGQRQRVAVGRAIVRQPAAFLFDEPLSNLDAKMRVQMRTEISRLHHQLETTMIYVTHDQVEAMTMGDRIVVMKDGEFQQVAPPLELYNNPANKFVAGFIGSPPMNFFSGHFRVESNQLWFDGGSFRVKVHGEMAGMKDGQEVDFGIRPEDVADIRFADTFTSEEKATASVDVIEQMGAEVLVYLKSGEHRFISRMGNRATCRVNDEVEVVFNMEKARYFDCVSGQRVG